MSARHQEELWRRRIFYFMERPDTTLAMLFNLLNLALIIGSVIISVLSTIQEYEDNKMLLKLTLYYELALLAWFSMEYMLRVWACSFLLKHKGFVGHIRFMMSFHMAIDAFVIISTLVSAILQIKTTYFSILRITRFIQIFRILRLDRPRGHLRTMGQLVYKHRRELVTCYFVGLIILFGGAYAVYMLEKMTDEEVTINNMGNGLYWAIVTVASVGYGDIAPQSWQGKLTASIFVLVGCAFFALPSGILGSGLALQAAKQKKERRNMKIRNPAAIVIQRCWRNHSLKRNNCHLQASWYYFSHQLKKPDFYKILPGIILKSDFLSPVYLSAEKDEIKSKRKDRKNGFDLPLTYYKKIVEEGEKKHHQTEDYPKATHKSSLLHLISPKYKGAIRFITRVKFWNAIKVFKNIRYPFVTVQDIMEKSACSHLETMSHLNRIHDCLADFHAEIEEIRNVLTDLQVQSGNGPNWQR
ncbi:potassium voltage-gated channel subfamily KQT member 4-like [Hydractinia symbiolongicarpus]|uniref:potassium voltage-gated channel subfamily KQT member 4-like n=1 Tax=Hydractinia symbiolongicarpus TaxID=13093 RepID=UPI00254CAD69|nr:potassium voltage-gated channel subfamily KQT member 4-like [Hydractinia symbiolongicarpus]